jgi:hypothetical protein
VDVIRPCPPTFCTFDPEAKKSPREILEKYEKESGQTVVLDSWEKVKRLKSASKAQGRLLDYRI